MCSPGWLPKPTTRTSLTGTAIDMARQIIVRGVIVRGVIGRRVMAPIVTTSIVTTTGSGLSACAIDRPRATDGGVPVSWNSCGRRTGRSLLRFKGLIALSATIPPGRSWRMASSMSFTSLNGSRPGPMPTGRRAWCSSSGTSNRASSKVCGVRRSAKPTLDRPDAAGLTANPLAPETSAGLLA